MTAGGGVQVVRPQITRRLVPLLDILFLLLAFFIIMPHGLRSVQQQLAAPPDWNKREVDRLVTLRLDEEGQVTLEGNRYRLAELAERLAELGPRDMVFLRRAWGAKVAHADELQRLLERKKTVYVVHQEQPR